jgi:hypothetical protein
VGTAVLVSEIIEEARVRLGLPTVSSSSFFGTANSLNLAKFSARRLSGIIRRLDSDYFLTTGSLSTTAGQNAVALPTNFSDLRQLSWMRGTNERVPLDMAGPDDWDATSEDAKAWDSAPRYRIQGGNVLLYPKPNAIYTLSIYYDTGIYVTATSDSISCQPGWDEWMVLDICVRVRQMEEVSAADFLAERNKVEADIVSQALTRDRFRTHQVRDLWEGGETIDSRSLYVRR